MTGLHINQYAAHSPPSNLSYIPLSQERLEISLAEAAIQTAAALFEERQEAEQYLSTIEEVAQTPFSDEEHERLYTLLSGKAFSGQLRQLYLKNIPPGALLDKLASIPNNVGHLQKTWIEQETIIKTLPTEITKLHLDGKEIGIAGAVALAALLPQTEITELAIGNDEIGVAGAKAVIEVLAQTKITTLILWECYLGNSAATALAAVLPRTKITELYLHANRIGDAGAIALAAALPHSKIKRLVLDYNLIDDAGAIALATAFSQSKIKHLRMRGNLYGFDGVTALKQERIRRKLYS